MLRGVQGSAPLRHFYLVLLDRALGDAVSASRESAALVQSGPSLADTLARTYGLALAARTLLDDGRPAEVLSIGASGYPVTAGDGLANASDRMVRAMALEATGHRQDALDAYDSFDGAYLSDLVMAAPAHLRRAAMFEREHLIADARREYEQAFTLWRHPDPSFQLVKQVAARRLAALRAE